MTIRALATAATAVAAFSLTPVAALAAEGSFERTLTVTGPVQLSVVAGSGDVTVRAGAAGRVVVRGTIRESRGWLASGDAAEAIRRVEQQPPIVQEGNAIRVGELDDALNRLVSVSYDITVPEATELRAKSGSGDVVAEGLARDVELSSGSGDVRASALKAAARVSTGSGDVRLDGGVAVRASTGSGDIVATGVRGSASLQTGSGDIRLDLAQDQTGDVSVAAASGEVRITGVRGALDASTASGDLAVDGAIGGAWSLNTASGDISLTLSGVAGFILDAHTTSGSIDTSLPVTVSGEIERRALKGDVRGGGPVLKVRSSSGTIVIR